MPAINGDTGYININTATATGTWGASIVGNVAYPNNYWVVPGERNPCGEITLSNIQECNLPVPEPEDLGTILRNRYSFFKKKIVNEVYIEEEE